MSTYDLHVTEADPARVVTVLPGSGYTAMAPLLWYARSALRDLGWTVRTLEWTSAPSFGSAREVYAEVLDGGDAPGGDALHLVVAKSLGTLAMPMAVRLGLPGVWLTPVLTGEQASDVRETAADLDEDHLLIGGTADPLWDGDLADGSEADVLEVENADHSLEVPGDRAENLAILDEVVSAIEEFAGSFGEE
ncbi:hypothetical protein [Promicromonospora iranensis]|uniref:Alpha/beta hydrolase n=1 Tax=Promicromonospora iranensis TaxID=1105144 RepID=A0ABU2CI89_9MICO|nr:hypothetical protein [Promicromonospora iranensis]MDR7381046.1 hypothetical protein [Promicromonospora iranensis]